MTQLTKLLRVALSVVDDRMSISWSRLIPGGVAGSPVSKEGVEFYNNVINELKKNGIEPAITLFHWDMPQASNSPCQVQPQGSRDSIGSGSGSSSAVVGAVPDNHSCSAPPGQVDDVICDHVSCSSCRFRRCCRQLSAIDFNNIAAAAAVAIRITSTDARSCGC